MGRNENPVLSAVDDAQAALSDLRAGIAVIAAHRPAGDVLAELQRMLATASRLHEHIKAARTAYQEEHHAKPRTTH